MTSARPYAALLAKGEDPDFQRGQAAQCVPAVVQAVSQRVDAPVDRSGPGVAVGGGATQGVGVRFPADEKSRLIKLRIEEILGTAISSSKPTQTI